MSFTKLLQLTEKEIISRPEAKCNNDPHYNPDKEMTTLIHRKLKCNLPWNNLKVAGFEDCHTEEHFENYLKEIIEQQEAIEGIPKKCKYKVWSQTSWADFFTDGNISSIDIDLMVTEGQVIQDVFCFLLTILLFLFVSEGQCRKGSLCPHH